MNKILLIKLWIILFTTIILIGGIKTVYAVTIIPTIYCIGGSAQPPCAPIPTDISPTISGSATQAQTSLSPTSSTNNPTATPTGGINNQITPTAAAPCTPVNQSSFSGTGSVATFRTHHKSSMGGSLSQFFQFLLQLFQLLLQLIGSNNPCLIGTPTTTPAPTVSISPTSSTTPGISPSSGASISPTNGTTPSISPSSGVSGNPTTNPSPSSGSNVNTPTPTTGTGSGNNNGTTPGSNNPGSSNPGSSNPGSSNPGSSSGPGSSGSSGSISAGNPYSPDKKNKDAVQPGDGNTCPQYYSYCKGSGPNAGLCIPNAGSCYAVVKPTNGFYCGDHTYQQYTPPTGAVSDSNRGVCKVCPRLASVKSPPNKTTGATSCTCNDSNQVVSYSEKTCVDKIVGCAASGYSDTNGVCTKCISGFQLSGGKCVQPPANGTKGSGQTCTTGECKYPLVCVLKNPSSGTCGTTKDICGGLTFGICPSGQTCTDSTNGYHCVTTPICGGLTFGQCTGSDSCIDSPNGYHCASGSSTTGGGSPACTKKKSGAICTNSNECCSNQCNSVSVGVRQCS